MGIDLTDPSDLDWLARGREDNSLQRAFEDLDTNAYLRERLRDAIAEELKSRDEKQFSDSEIKRAVTGVLTSVGEEAVTEIERRVWTELETSSVEASTFVETYLERVGTEIVDTFDRKRGTSNSETNSSQSRTRSRHESVVR